jgi:hypothetical protein
MIAIRAIRGIGSSRLKLLLLTFTLLLLLRIPYLLTHHVQEDSYITFRTAFNLADNGIFSFNLDEHIPATTSLIYPLLVAVFRLSFGGWAVYGVQIFGSALVIVACNLVARSIATSERDSFLIWIGTACSPMSLFVGYSGMETPLLLIDIALLVYCLRNQSKAWAFSIGLFFLPFLRPDAISYGFILCIAMFLLNRQRSVFGLGALGVGVATLLGANHMITGKAITGTMRAKEIAYHPSHTFSSISHRLTAIYFGNTCFLAPFEAYRIFKVAFVLLPIVGVCFFYAFRTTGKDPRRRIILGSLLAITLIVPAAFAAGGVIFPWYTYPSNWIAEIVVMSACISFALSRSSLLASRTAWVLIVTGIMTFALWQLMISFVIGTQEYHYRADVGRYLADVSHGKGTLLLEPAGYIPFFSHLHTQDEVGLASDNILKYMRVYPASWWIEYVKNERPTYIVQRDTFKKYVTYQGYALSPSDVKWFQQHYQLLETRSYNPDAYFHNRMLRKVLVHSWTLPEYLVYESKQVP